MSRPRGREGRSPTPRIGDVSFSSWKSGEEMALPLDPAMPRGLGGSARLARLHRSAQPDRPLGQSPWYRFSLAPTRADSMGREPEGAGDLGLPDRVDRGPGRPPGSPRATPSEAGDGPAQDGADPIASLDSEPLQEGDRPC
jgi:hypothetical protein